MKEKTHSVEKRAHPKERFLMAKREAERPEDRVTFADATVRKAVACVFDAVRRQHFLDLVNYMAYLAPSTRVALLDQFVTRVWYPKGSRRNCSSKPEPFYTLGLVFNHADMGEDSANAGRAGATYMKGNADGREHENAVANMLLANAYITLLVLEEPEKWGNFFWTTATLNFNWFTAAHVDGNNLGPSL